MRKNIDRKGIRVLRRSAPVLAAAAIFACMAACVPAQGGTAGQRLRPILLSQDVRPDVLPSGLFHREARTLPLTPGMKGNLAGLHMGG